MSRLRITSTRAAIAALSAVVLIGSLRLFLFRGDCPLIVEHPDTPLGGDTWYIDDGHHAHGRAVRLEWGRGWWNGLWVKMTAFDGFSGTGVSFRFRRSGDATTACGSGWWSFDFGPESGRFQEMRGTVLLYPEEWWEADHLEMRFDVMAFGAGPWPQQIRGQAIMDVDS